tara:strand:- start:3466 stop:5574 length:2109 start_codon:yes stop_codon:yes gene_type:complete
MWVQINEDGTGEITGDESAFLYAAVRLLANGLTDDARENLGRGLFLPVTFPWHRPHWDSCLTQYWRSARKFDREQYVATLAETGFTHVEVNGLQAHMPMEDSVQSEYYPQFYTYTAGFNHFIDTPLTEGLWQPHYLEANLNNLKSIVALGRKYGLKPGVCMFEPRTLPERFFQRYPTLRGARVDHPFRSRLPRYCLAQDHPVTKQHYRAAIKNLMKAAPDLSYMSVWTNDSGAGFEHTGSLYVGRNGGPYMIREWRNHEKVAQAAGESITRYLANIQGAAAETNPDFDIILRLEPFKLEQNYIKKGMSKHITWEAPSLLVKGYTLPYTHPKYPEMSGVAGSPLQTEIDESERKVLAESRAQGAEPTMQYAIGSSACFEPLLGVPYPRLLRKKLESMRDLDLKRISGFGGLNNTGQTPYWPNPAVIRATQFTPEVSIDDVLINTARGFVGEKFAAKLVSCWDDFEEAVSWQPPVMLFSGFGFTWQRTLDRPYVPDIEAIPAKDRAYYERHGCFQHNNPGMNDLGKDVLFDIVTKEQGFEALKAFDKNSLPRIDKLVAKLEKLEAQTVDQPKTQAAFSDLLDRTRGYRIVCGSIRMVCAWCAHVYSYLDSTKAAEKKKHEKALQVAIDEELINTQNLIQLLETDRTEFMVLSGVANNTFCYGEDLSELLRSKIRLMKKYRHKKPRIDKDILWRPIPGADWPKFD